MIVQINMLDEIYPYKGYVLVNDVYEDDEGFYKNSWMWGIRQKSYILDAHEIKGLSSNAYADFSEAHKKFTQLVDKKLAFK